MGGYGAYAPIILSSSCRNNNDRKCVPARLFPTQRQILIHVMHYKVYVNEMMFATWRFYALVPSLDMRLFMKSKKANWLALMP
jgi:hypothetical protein